MMGRLMAVGLLLGGIHSICSAQAPADNIKIINNSLKLDKANVPNEVTRPTSDVAKELSDDWYVAEVKFSTQDPITEEVQVKFYIDGLDSLKNDLFVVLTGEETYVNVPKGEHYAVMYLDPMALLRYGGKKDKARGFKKSNLHIEILSGGQVQDKLSKNERSEKDDPNWFTAGQQTPGVLIGVKDSPWWPFDARRYNRIKPKN